jgi:hypothetical protein
MRSQVSVSMTRSAETEDRLGTREPFLWINATRRNAEPLSRSSLSRSSAVREDAPKLTPNLHQGAF